MTPSELIDAAQRAGATIVVEAGKARVRGAKLPDELLALLKEHKEAVMAEVQARQAVDRDRYGKVPPTEAPMVAGDARLTERTRALVMGHVFRQGRPLHAWVQTRGQKYFEAGTPAVDADAAACVDVLAWQRNADARTAVRWLAELPTEEELREKTNKPTDEEQKK